MRDATWALGMIRTMFVKGSCNKLLSGDSVKHIEPFYRTKAHQDVLLWLKGFAREYPGIERIVWDGDRVHAESFTYLLKDFRRLYPNAQFIACRLEGSGYSNFHQAGLGQVKLEFIPQPRKNCNKFVYLGNETMKRYQDGAVVFALGGGPTLWGEFQEAVRLPFKTIWYCLELAGWSSVTKEENRPIFAQFVTSSNLPMFDHEDLALTGRRYELNKSC